MIDDTKPRTSGLSYYVSSLRHCKADGFWWAGKMGWDPGTSSPFWIESCNGYFVTSLAHVCLTSLFPHFSLLFLKNFWLCNHSEFCIVYFTVPWELKLLATFCCCIWWKAQGFKGAVPELLWIYWVGGWQATLYSSLLLSTRKSAAGNLEHATTTIKASRMELLSS